MGWTPKQWSATASKIRRWGRRTGGTRDATSSHMRGNGRGVQSHEHRGHRAQVAEVTGADSWAVLDMGQDLPQLSVHSQMCQSRGPRPRCYTLSEANPHRWFLRSFAGDKNTRLACFKPFKLAERCKNVTWLENGWIGTCLCDARLRKSDGCVGTMSIKILCTAVNTHAFVTTHW